MDGSDQGIWKWDIDTALLSTFVERKNKFLINHFVKPSKGRLETFSDGPLIIYVKPHSLLSLLSHHHSGADIFAQLDRTRAGFAPDAGG